MMSENAKFVAALASQDTFLAPSPALLVKLGSIIVHADEFTSGDGHEFDLGAMKVLLADPAVKAWIADGTKRALLPLKRKKI
jgi:hypothetical protein